MPADPLDGVRRELAPVFAQLEPVLAECARITAEATDIAHRREAEAAGQAHDIVASAQTESEAERANTAATARATAASETEQHLTQARTQAQEVRRRGEQRRPELLTHVIDRVRADLQALS